MGKLYHILFHCYPYSPRPYLLTNVSGLRLKKNDLLNRVAATTSKTEIETHAMDENYDDNANTSFKQLRLSLDPR